MSGVMNIAVSGMSAQADKLSVIANNIANSGTLAYKSQTAQFSEAFVASGRTTASGSTIQYGTGAEVSSITADWDTGSAQVTNDQADILISGDGFLPVSLGGSTYYTRACDFSLTYDNTTSEYVLMRSDGSVLSGYTDATMATPALVSFATQPTAIEIKSDGSVTAIDSTGAVIGTFNLGVTTFVNNDSLESMGQGLYRATTSSGAGTINTPGTGGAGSLTQGALEESNTDLVTEFTNMIVTQRAFQANSKVITTQDELLNTIITM